MKHRSYWIRFSQGIGAALFSMALSLPGLQAQVAPEFGTHIAFNGGDFNWGGQFGVDFVPIDLSLRADFTGRAGSKRVLVESPDNPDILIQYREARYLLGLEAEKRITVFEPDDAYIGFSAGIFGGLSFGDYRGTDVAPYSGFTYRARLAPFVLLDQTVLFKAGYEYLPTRTEDISNHRVFISVNFLLMSE